jgi:hypothetical protein
MLNGNFKIFEIRQNIRADSFGSFARLDEFSFAGLPQSASFEFKCNEFWLLHEHRYDDSCSAKWHFRQEPLEFDGICCFVFESWYWHAL